MGKACQLSHAVLPRPFRRQPVSLRCIIEEASFLGSAALVRPQLRGDQNSFPTLR